MEAICLPEAVICAVPGWSYGSGDCEDTQGANQDNPRPNESKEPGMNRHHFATSFWALDQKSVGLRRPRECTSSSPSLPRRTKNLPSLRTAVTGTQSAVPEAFTSICKILVSAFTFGAS